MPALAGHAQRATAPAPEARIAAKFANFKQAVDAGKHQIERDSDDRARRRDVYETCAAAADEAEQQESLRQQFRDWERRAVRTTWSKAWTTGDFEAIRVLGQGSFGTVHLVRQRDTSELLALKQMSKANYCRKNLRDRAFAERELLAEAKSRWFVELLATFQDASNVYMVMEFVAGGDLCSHLDRRKSLSEDETRFYMAELLVALEVVHSCGFVHRDVKPDNVILTVSGHLKLLDFGLCKPDPNAPEPFEGHAGGARGGMTRRQKLKSQVGTPQYMSPEAYKGDISTAGDIWAVGVLTFECLYGGVPFHANGQQGREGLLHMTDLVERHAEVFPQRLAKLNKAIFKGLMPHATEQFLQRVICDVRVRLDVEGCRREPFFEPLDFSRLHLMTAPIIPELKSSDDTSYFDDFGVKELPPSSRNPEKDVALEWPQYEFDRERHELQRPEALAALFNQSEKH